VNGSASDVANRADMDRRCRGVVAVDGCAAQLRRMDAEARSHAPALDTREEEAPEGGSASLGGSCSDADDVAGRSAP
jgi:diaminopimelate decarboxylase